MNKFEDYPGDYKTYMHLATKYKGRYHKLMDNGDSYHANIFKMWFYYILRKAEAAGYKLNITLEYERR